MHALAQAAHAYHSSSDDDSDDEDPFDRPGLRLTAAQRLLIVTLKRDGVRNAKIAEKVQCSTKSV
jgi:hypothetical protein